MRRVLLLTWYENNNYGTSLQAYALKNIIENPGITGFDADITERYECVLLPHKPVRKISGARKFWKIFKLGTYVQKLEQARDWQIYRNKKEKFDLRDRVFREFTRNNFVFAESKDAQTKEELEKICLDYDCILSGSDQIWNPEALDPTYLMYWVPDSKRKISYGSSLSVRKIPKKFYNIYKEALSRFYKISIRDTACRAQLEQIVGKEVMSVVDPVILLGRESLSKMADVLTEKSYMFCYFLGNNRTHREQAVNYAKRKGMDIKAIIHVGSNYDADTILGDYAVWDVDLWGFVSLINNADLVMTDSFHATVISTLLHKNFVVFEKDSRRTEQNNRILEFLSLAGLEKRWEANMEELEVVSEELWKKSDICIDKKRRESFDYLMEALK